MSELKKTAIIFTDGSCEPNPGPGGWAALIRYSDGQELKLSGGEKQSTNNRMELTAALEALKAIKQPVDVVIYTDSQYLQKGITEWLPNWKARNWKRKGGALANQELWMSLDNEIVRHHIQWKWVKGHAGNVGNQIVDQLAHAAMIKFR
jgi:ribonuclease HI